MSREIMLAALEAFLQQQCSDADGPLSGVCRYAVEGGRRTRALLLLHAAERDDAVALQAACAVEMLHAATLLQDDIFDASAQRRGRVAAHVHFGKAQSILASDWLLVRSLELSMETHPAFFRQMARAATNMAQAVAHELEPGRVNCVGTAEMQIAGTAQGKTAVLFASCLYAAALLQRRIPRDPQQWHHVGARIGCVYQLMDDCMDVYASPECMDKSVGSDLAAGRLTLPVLLAYRKLNGTISMTKLLAAELAPSELAAMRLALYEPDVREDVRSRVEDNLEGIATEAASAEVPTNAVAFCLADMQRKLQMCFGRQIPGFSLAGTGPRTDASQPHLE